MTKLEEVARAICLGASEVMPDDIPKDCESLCSMCLSEARAAIQALMEPSEGMVDAAVDATDLGPGPDGGGPDGYEIRTAYQAMLTAALEEE